MRRKNENGGLYFVKPQQFSNTSKILRIQTGPNSYHKQEFLFSVSENQLLRIRSVAWYFSWPEYYLNKLKFEKDQTTQFQRLSINHLNNLEIPKQGNIQNVLLGQPLSSTWPRFLASCIGEELQTSQPRTGFLPSHIGILTQPGL